MILGTMKGSSSLCIFLSTSTYLFHLEAPSVDSFVSGGKHRPSSAIWICDKNTSSKSEDGMLTTAGSTSLDWFCGDVFVSPLIVTIVHSVAALPFDLLLPVCERRR